MGSYVPMMNESMDKMMHLLKVKINFRLFYFYTSLFFSN